MTTKVHMEALSPTMEEGQLVRWLKAEGDSVSSGDILAEIETDKATMELVARGDGVLRKILLGKGGTAPVGEVIAIIAGSDEDISALVADAGGGETPAVPSPSTPQVAAIPAPGATLPVPSEMEATELKEGERVKASPLARRMAQDASMDLSRIQGSGPGGRVVKRDVEAARVATGAVAAPSGGTAPSPGPQQLPAVAGSAGVDFEDIPLSQMRKTIARRLVESLGPVPHFFLRITVDMSRILEARKRVNQILEKDGEKVSINDFFLRATAQALYRHPEVNSQWMGESVRRNYRVHLGVAVAVEDGLITPVVRDANLKGLAEISRVGETVWHGPAALGAGAAVSRVLTLLNSPNPFTASTAITFNLPDARPVRLSVYDAQGRRVRTLIDAVESPGEHTVIWNGRSDSGRRTAAGLYILRLEAGPESLVKKIVFSR